MNKIAMDALNAGWAIGVGTRITQPSKYEGFAAHRSSTVGRADRDLAPWPILTLIPSIAASILASLRMLPQLASSTAHRLHLTSTREIKLGPWTGGSL